MRGRVAQIIVRWVARPIERDYAEYMRGRRTPRHIRSFRRRQRFGLPLAIWIDKDAACDQIALESWWG